MIKFEDLTLGEVEEIELLINGDIDSAFKEGKPKARAARAIVYIMKKRENPNFKFEDTAGITQAEAFDLITGDDPKAQ